MLSIYNISIRALIIGLIGVFSLLAFFLAFYISEAFKNEAFDSQEKLLSRFISVTAYESILNMDDVLTDLGTELQSDRALRKLFKQVIKGDASDTELSSALNESFNRRFHTAGLVNLQKVRSFDKNLNPIASSSQGVDGLSSGLNINLKERAAAREGSDKLKMLQYFWDYENKPYYSMLVPVGGLRVVGYVEIVVDPVHNLKLIETSLEKPVQIKTLSSDVTFQSEKWPKNLDNFLEANYVLKNKDGRNVLKIIAAFDNSELVESVNWVRNSSLGLFLIGTGLFVISAFIFLNKTLFVPVKALVEEMNQTACGNLLVDIDSYGIREVHVLSNTLDGLVSGLRENVRLILENSNNLFESANHLSEAAENNKRGIYVQQDQTEQVATAMNEMNATVAEVAKNTSAAAEAAIKSQDKSLLGKSTVDQVIVTINDLSDNILQAEGLIEKLNKESDAISSILDVITSIAEQTNLLALNAAIEAARAGEAGRGFAVVADEVRSLATRTQESASDIRHMVESLQEGTTGAVEAMSISRNTADKAVDEIHQAGTAIDEVSAAVGLMSDINTQIATAAEEQTAVVDEINQNIVKIRDVGVENTSIARETAEEGTDMLQVAELLREAVQRFKV